MKKTSTLLLSFLAATLAMAKEPIFTHLKLSPDKTTLQVFCSDGSVFTAPKVEDQDSFDTPAISADGNHVGWLALYPGQGASYSLPLELVVLFPDNQEHRFAGNFGMVFHWCFVPNSNAVVYEYSQAHGNTPTGFDMRSLDDGKLLKRTLVKPTDSAADAQSGSPGIPSWANCLGTHSN